MIVQHAAVIAATVHDALHPEAPWDSLPMERRQQLAGFFSRLIVDGVIVPGAALQVPRPHDGDAGSVRASQLIAALQAAMAERGDRDVLIDYQTHEWLELDAADLVMDASTATRAVHLIGVGDVGA